MKEVKRLLSVFFNMKRAHQVMILGTLAVAVKEALGAFGVTIPEETWKHLAAAGSAVVAVGSVWAMYRNSGADERADEAGQD